MQDTQETKQKQSKRSGKVCPSKESMAWKRPDFNYCSNNPSDTVYTLVFLMLCN